MDRVEGQPRLRYPEGTEESSGGAGLGEKEGTGSLILPCHPVDRLTTRVGTEIVLIIARGKATFILVAA